MKRYWHFLPADRRLRYGDNRLIETGSVVTVPRDDELRLCGYGLHASHDIMDALKNAPGPIICRVTLNGEVVEGNDKAVAYERRVLWMVDATDTLRQFAYWSADRAVRVHAVAALRAAGDRKGASLLESLPRIVDRETAERARAAARDAAWAAASAAASAAAWAAAWAAARDAAWDAARDAARAAASAAAWAAERKIQSRKLTAMMLELGRGAR